LDWFAQDSEIGARLFIGQVTGPSFARSPHDDTEGLDMARQKPAAHFFLGDRQIWCLFCQHDQFRRREVKLTTTGMSALNLDWANPSADGLTCTACGYVHLFDNDSLRSQAI
jgi:predicted nucleic-acid-binding Zn-ribbon protein